MNRHRAVTAAWLFAVALLFAVTVATPAGLVPFLAVATIGAAAQAHG